MPAEGAALQRARLALGGRRVVLLGIAVAALWAALHLGLSPSDLIPTRGGLALAGEFLRRAGSPALSYEGGPPGPGAPPLLWKAAEAAYTTFIFAAAAVSLALAAGFPLALLASESWWWGRGRTRRGPWARLARLAAPAAYGAARTAIALLRSVHELLWAVLFLAAFGRSNLAAVLAIAIPYAGTFAKVFSELLDETPRDAAEALAAAGSPSLLVFAFGLLPRALPDISAYAFYRFECALRSSAVLGFFGYPTLGYYVAAAFENLHYGEVWTYLYTLFALVLGADLWSGALRRHFVA
jgi:phosphonate transport system permease protein